MEACQACSLIAILNNTEWRGPRPEENWRRAEPGQLCGIYHWIERLREWDKFTRQRKALSLCIVLSVQICVTYLLRSADKYFYKIKICFQLGKVSKIKKNKKYGIFHNRAGGVYPIPHFFFIYFLIVKWQFSVKFEVFFSVLSSN